MDPDRLAEEHLDLVDKVAWDVVRKFRIASRFKDDVWSASGLALVVAARRFDGRQVDPRGYLRQKMFWLVVDSLRELSGRKTTERYRREREILSLNHRGYDDDDEDTTCWVVDESAQIPFEKAGDLDEIREYLATLPTDRHREIVLRLMAGETQREVGERFGVTESRICQIVAKMRYVMCGDTEWGGEELWEEPVSVYGSWR